MPAAHFTAAQWSVVFAARSLLSLDADTAEERYSLEPADKASPDTLFRAPAAAIVEFDTRP
jgi:hypothetical protein